MISPDKCCESLIYSPLVACPSLALNPIESNIHYRLICTSPFLAWLRDEHERGCCPWQRSRRPLFHLKKSRGLHCHRNNCKRFAFDCNSLEGLAFESKIPLVPTTVRGLLLALSSNHRFSNPFAVNNPWPLVSFKTGKTFDDWRLMLFLGRTWTKHNKKE